MFKGLSREAEIILMRIKLGCKKWKDLLFNNSLNNLHYYFLFLRFVNILVNKLWYKKEIGMVKDKLWKLYKAENIGLRKVIW